MSFNEWNEVKLSDICDLISRGITPSYTEDKSEGIVVINQKCIRDNCINLELARLTNPAKKKVTDTKYLKQYDILVNSTGVGTLGRVAQVKKLDEKMTVDSHVTIVRANNKVNPVFLGYNLFMQQRFIEYLGEGSTGQTELSRIRLGEALKLKLPSIEEQKSIAKILSDLDNKIEVNNKINQRLEDMAQSIFKSWFVDFEFPNEEGNPYKSSGGEMAESELGMIPKGWEVNELNEIFTFKKGKKPKEISEAKENENYKKYLTIDVLNQNSELFANTEKVVECDDDDVLMVMDGASSGAIFTGMSGIVGSTLSKLEVKNNVLKSFIFQLLKFREVDIKSHLTGSAIPHADKNYIYAQKVALPNDTDLLNILTKTFRLSMNKIRLKNVEINKLKTTRDTLLPKLMSGEIRVPIN